MLLAEQINELIN